MTQQKTLGLVLSTAGLLGIAAATLTPLPLLEARAAETSFWCLVCGSLGSVDVILNLALFLPLGAGLRWLGWPLPRVALASFLTSSSVEALQIIAITGRDASVSDLLTNTIGGIAGFILANYWRTLVFATPKQASKLVAAWTVVAMAVFATTAAMLRPSLPLGTWHGIIAPIWPGHGVFGGTVLQARVGDHSVPRDTLPHSEDYRHEILSGAPVLARFVTGSDTPNDVAPIVMLASARHESLTLLSQRNRDVLFDVRLRASAWRFRSPRLRVGHAIPMRSGDTVVAWGGLDRGQLYAGAAANERWQIRRLRLSIALGWALISPVEWGLGPETLPINAVWLLILICPMAYWATRTRRRSALIGVGITVLLVMGAVPQAFGLEVTHWSEWVAGIVAVSVGVMAGNHVGTRSPESR